jgi:gamma-glutamyltranspeptidase/glutathione hydrolase
MSFQFRRTLLSCALVAMLPAQEVSQSGLRLQAPRALVALPERAPQTMAASVQGLATDAALEVMRKGGNAIDAAVAIAFALAVVHPEAGNIGGGGFLMAHLADGRNTVIDYAFQAPLALKPDLFDGSAGPRNVGYKSIGVPGMPAGMGMAHAKYGKLKWAECLEPARRLAKQGFPASQRIEMILQLQVPVMRTYPETAKIFLKGSDQPLKQGETIVQKELADTIARMQKQGWREFYTGETGRRIVADMRANGGIVSAADLDAYQAMEKEPLRISYRGTPVLVTPLASGGGTQVAVALNVLENFELKLGAEGSSRTRHLQIEAMRAGVEARRLLTTGLKTIDVLLSKEYAREIAAGISFERAGSSSAPPAAPTGESEDTTHFTVADAYGNVVTNTYTLNGFYGSQVIPKGTGVLMNNYISPQNVREVTPGERILSSMSPTIILRADNSVQAAFGTPGSTTIPSTLIQIAVNLLDFKMGLRDAVEYPRIHFGGSGAVEAEPGAMVDDVREKLRALGHQLGERFRSQGDVNAVAVEEKTAWKQGWADGRRGGVVKGY